ncbi:predicted protein [Enterococcus gallinarum EG2]|nr:predicted protein [Enterococcus gallinarum EG2]
MFKSAYFLLTSLFFSLSVFVTLQTISRIGGNAAERLYRFRNISKKRLLRHGHIARAFSYRSAIICFGPVSAVTDFFSFLI